MKQSLHFELQEEGLRAALNEIDKKREKNKDSRFSLLFSVNIIPDGIEVKVSNRSVEIVEYPLQETSIEETATNDA